MTTVQTALTADLSADTLVAARALLDDVFEDMTDFDWDHALGGVHALIWEGGELTAHASVVPRTLLHEGRPLRAGYVEAVAVRADRRRRGLGGAVMEAIEKVVVDAYDLGALGAADRGKPLYAARGWRVWQGRTLAVTPAGIVSTPAEDGDIYVLPRVVPLDIGGDLTCDWREGDLW